MKKILFLVRSLNNKTGGGSHYNAIEQIRLFRDLGYSVDVHTFTSGANEPPEDIQVVEHHCGKYGFLKERTELEHLLKNNESKTDLFFLYGVDFVWGAGSYRKGGGEKPVSVYLDTYLASMGILNEHRHLYRLKRHFWDKIFGLRLARYVDRYFAVSPWVESVYFSFGFPKAGFRIFPNFFHFDHVPKRNFTSMKRPITLLYTGRITYDKGIDLLISALAQLRDEDWQLKIIGEGPLKETCVNLSRAKELAERIEFIPWISQKDLRDAYLQSDIFIHPARWPEPFGRTIVEALSAGLPVIVPRSGAPAWIAQEAGYIFENNDQKNLVTTLKMLLTDYEEQRETLSQKAIARAEAYALKKNRMLVKHLLDEIV